MFFYTHKHTLKYTSKCEHYSLDPDQMLQQALGFRPRKVIFPSQGNPKCPPILLLREGALRNRSLGTFQAVIGRRDGKTALQEQSSFHSQEC